MELNLNTVQRQTLNLTLMDEEQTVLRVKIPSVKVFKEMQRMSSTLDKIEDGDEESIEVLYHFIARVLSCNRDRIKVTAEELESKYNMDLEDVLLVFSAYMDFINTIVTVKN